jgi:hypothetical protein
VFNKKIKKYVSTNIKKIVNTNQRLN